MSKEAITLMKLASYWIMRLRIVVFCSVAINLLLYDVIILMPFMPHNKLEYACICKHVYTEASVNPVRL